MKWVHRAAAWIIPLLPAATGWAQQTTMGPFPGPARETASSSPEPIRPGIEEWPGGLSLDAAVDRLLRCNSTLRAKFLEISEARADELTAGLRNSPVLYVSGSALPYEPDSPRRPGVPNAEVAPTQNVDYANKRRAHMKQAAAARRETEARFQDAVRLEIDRLYDDFVAVVDAEDRVLAAKARLAYLDRLKAIVEEMVRRGARPGSDVEALALQRFDADMELEDREPKRLEARRNLAERLAIPADRAERLQVRTDLPTEPDPPGVPELLGLAMSARPDLAAARLTIASDEATLQVTRKERFDDAIVFWAPYEAQDYRPQGKRSATGWGIGAIAAVPILDRNQGYIARARANMAQGGIELEATERGIMAEVRRGLTEYWAARELVGRFERERLPAARRVLSERSRGYAAGREAIESYLTAEQGYHEVERRYEGARSRLRRGRLKLNTVTGTRLLP